MPVTFLALDVDGVLLNSAELVYQCYQEAAVGRGYGIISQKGFNFGYFMEYMWGRTFHEAGEIGVWEGNFEQAAQLHDEKQRLYNLALHNYNDFSIAASSLAKVWPKDHMAFVTAASYEASKKIIEKIGCGSKELVCGCNGKRNSSFWREFAIKRAPHAEEVMVIDDDAKVISAAKHAGCTTIHWTEYERR